MIFYNQEDVSNHLIKILKKEDDENVSLYGLIFVNELLQNYNDSSFLNIMIEKNLILILNKLALNSKSNKVIYETLKCFLNVQNCSDYFEITMADNCILNIDNCCKFGHTEIIVVILELYYQMCYRNIKISEKLIKTNTFKYICFFLKDENIDIKSNFYLTICAMNFLAFLIPCEVLTKTEVIFY